MIQANEPRARRPKGLARRDRAGRRSADGGTLPERSGVRRRAITNLYPNGARSAKQLTPSDGFSPCVVAVRPERGLPREDWTVSTRI